jgi:hypothetical protein
LFLGDSQDQGLTGSATGAASITRVSTWSIDLHACSSSRGDHGARDRGLQLLTASRKSAERRPIDYHHRRRNKLTAVDNKQKALLHFRERNCTRRKGRDDWRRASTSAQGIERVAALEHEQGKQKRGKTSQGSVDSSHTASYTRDHD